MSDQQIVDLIADVNKLKAAVQKLGKARTAANDDRGRFDKELEELKLSSEKLGKVEGIWDKKFTSLDKSVKASLSSNVVKTETFTEYTERNDAHFAEIEKTTKKRLQEIFELAMKTQEEKNALQEIFLEVSEETGEQVNFLQQAIKDGAAQADEDRRILSKVTKTLPKRLKREDEKLKLTPLEHTPAKIKSRRSALGTVETAPPPPIFDADGGDSNDDSKDDDSSAASAIDKEDECKLVELNWDEVVTRRWYLLFQETFEFLNTTWPLTIDDLKAEKTFYNFLRNQLNCRLSIQQASKVNEYIEEIAKQMQLYFNEVPDTEDEFIESTIRLLCDIDYLQFY